MGGTGDRFLVANGGEIRRLNGMKVEGIKTCRNCSAMGMVFAQLALETSVDRSPIG